MAIEHHYDLVIVGGGPAGSSVAYEASKNGIKVALLEKEETIAQSVRTSGVTWIQNIKEFGIPDYCYNPIKNYSFCSPNNEVTIKDEIAHAAVLDVRKTYQWLAEQAKKEGTDIFLKTNIKDVIKNDKGDIVGVSGTSKDGNITFHAKIIVDASGFSSTVSKAMGFVTQWERFGAGAEYEVEAENVDQETWWLMVGQKYSPAGYAWIFPVGKNIVRIGVGVGKPESDIDPTERLKKLMDSKVGPISKLGKITPIEFHYGLIPNDGLSRKTVYNNLILVGDSAGQANPLVLEGIRYAIKFGRVAGKIAADAIKSGKTDEKALYPYEESWRKDIQAKIKTAGKVQDRWIGL
ncbi:MAG: NAD(P)/FAD-dependent oxidoreductase, partial [Nitrosarchaeum sp.]